MSQESQTEKIEESKPKFPYPRKIQGLLDPVFYTITNEEVEDKDSFEGVENIYMIEKDGVKIPLVEAVTYMLSTSLLAKLFINLFKRVVDLRKKQKAYFKTRLDIQLEIAKEAEYTVDNYIEVCRTTYETLVKVK
ncbi:hypothetical protein WAF17_16630 [Bernardetia sp. ABR2-2B]|uniref:hypothetical protein n=1 Tax=Bernardetia sp. ABR2-2B TaxID=3127472 RepID=UPI0030D28D49